MLAVKGRYHDGKVELLEPIPSNISSANLTIVVLPETAENGGRQSSPEASLENEFELLGGVDFVTTSDDSGIDWEKHFGLKQ